MICAVRRKSSPSEAACEALVDLCTEFVATTSNFAAARRAKTSSDRLDTSIFPSASNEASSRAEPAKPARMSAVSFIGDEGQVVFRAQADMAARGIHRTE